MHKRIEQIKEYFVAFNIAEDIAYILISFPEKWELPSSSVLEENFDTKTATETDGKIYFFSDLSNGVNNVFDAVDFVVEYNKELEEKTELFMEKINYLKELFSTKTLDELKKLQISISQNTLPFTPPNTKEIKQKAKRRSKKDVPVNETTKNNEVKNGIIATTEEKKDEKTEDNNSDSLLSFAQDLINNRI